MKLPRSAFRKITEYFYVDQADNVYFSLKEFFERSALPDNPQLREVVIEDIQSLIPGILILEQWVEGASESEN